jgi:hypothetical protein
VWLEGWLVSIHVHWITIILIWARTRLLSYDFDANLALLVDGDIGLIVDVSLCIDWLGKWCKERLVPVMAVGHVEVSKVIHLALPFR